jgi:DNA invertase Pin-like site-specific DNA recombinase
MPKKAISYIRFSTPEQLKGSFKRQYEATLKYCKENDYELEESFYDKGVSAYKGANRSTGDFAKLLKKVESGEIPKGTLLIVESLDRISREDPYKALPQFMGLVSKGIDILTLSDGFIHTDQNKDPIRLIIALMVIIRANEESEIKSQRLSSAWSNKRDEAVKNNKPLTSILPSWLKLEDKDKIAIIEDRAVIVKNIYELALNGMGRRAIAKELNQRGIPIWSSDKRSKSKLWVDSYVQKILTNPAVMGVFQPHKKTDNKRVPIGDPIKNYFPEVIDEDLYYAVQSQIKSRKQKGGRAVHKAQNLLSSITYCAVCGGKLCYANKGHEWKYLMCQNSKNGVRCNAPNIRYALVEDFILQELISDQWNKTESVDERIQEVKFLIESQKAQLDKNTKACSNLTKAIQLCDEGIDQLVTALEDRQTEKKEIESKLEELKRELANANTSSTSTAANYAKLYAKVSTGEENDSLRRNLKSQIAEKIDKVFIQRLSDNNIALILALKNKQVCVGKVGGKNQSRFSCLLSDWQLDTSHKRNVLSYDLEVLGKEIDAILKPKLLTIPKGTDAISMLSSKEAQQTASSHISYPKKVVGIQTLNKKVKDQLKEEEAYYRSQAPNHVVEFKSIPPATQK